MTKIGVEMVLMSQKDYDRMKNCVNCDHQAVCLEVARRKVAKAGNYTPCSHWKQTEAGDGQ